LVDTVRVRTIKLEVGGDISGLFAEPGGGTHHFAGDGVNLAGREARLLLFFTAARKKNQNRKKNKWKGRAEEPAGPSLKRRNRICCSAPNEHGTLGGFFLRRLQQFEGFANSFAGWRAPKIGAAFIFVAASASAAQLAYSVRKPYMILSGLAFLMAIITHFVHLPDVIEAREKDSLTDGSAWKFRHLRLGAVGIFVYVGAEVAIGSLMINFLGQPSMGGMSHAAAAEYVSLYWGGAMVGRLIGFFALKWISAPKALTFVTVLASIFVTTAILGHGHVALWAIVSCGLFNSVMWPCIFPMSVAGLGKFTSQGSGILVTMVVGGAVIPEIQGFLADSFGYQRSFVIVLLCYLYILYFALRGHRNLNAVAATNALNPGVIQ